MPEQARLYFERPPCCFKRFYNICWKVRTDVADETALWACETAHRATTHYLDLHPIIYEGRVTYCQVEPSPAHRARTAALAASRTALEAYLRAGDESVQTDSLGGCLLTASSSRVVACVRAGSILWVEATLREVWPHVDIDRLRSDTAGI